MTPEQHALMVKAARNLLAEKAAGRRCDPVGIKWALQVVANAERRRVAA